MYSTVNNKVLCIHYSSTIYPTSTLVSKLSISPFCLSHCLSFTPTSRPYCLGKLSYITSSQVLLSWSICYFLSILIYIEHERYHFVLVPICLPVFTQCDNLHFYSCSNKSHYFTYLCSQVVLNNIYSSKIIYLVISS